MDYIRNIREHIGHDLVMTVGCGVLVEDDEGRVLLQKRSDTGEWCIPGGGMEPVETFEETAIRELRDDSCIIRTAFLKHPDRIPIIRGQDS